MKTRNLKTSYKPRPAGSLKAATDQLVNAVGGQKRAAEFAGKSRTVMARYTDDGDNDRWMPVDVVRLLETIAGYPYVTAYMAIEAGFVLSATSGGSVSDGGKHDLAGHLATAVKEFSDVSVASIEALADGQTSEFEARRIIKESKEAIDALAKLHDNARASVEQAKEGNGG